MIAGEQKREMLPVLVRAGLARGAACLKRMIRLGSVSFERETADFRPETSTNMNRCGSVKYSWSRR